MATKLSPGLLFKETNLSQVVRAVGSTTSAIVIFAKKGPVMERQLITSDKQFVEVFGEPDPSLGYGHYAALAFLKEGNILWVTRVVHDGRAGGVAATYAGAYAD